MPREYAEIQDVIRHGASDTRLDAAGFEVLAKSRYASLDEAFNSIAIEIARLFHRSILSFEEADRAINAVAGLMIRRAVDADAALPEPAWSIYLAFDAGEWDHGDGTDPVERHTMPLLKKAIGEA